MNDLRVLITHDWLVTWGGAERVLAEILKIVPSADLITAVRAPAMSREHVAACRAKETWIARIPGARDHHRWFLPLHYAAFSTLDTRGYDLVISSSHAFAKAVRPTAATPHVSYCHSPPRYLWDMGPAYRRHTDALRSGALALSTPTLRWLDRKSATGVTQFVGNSRFVAQRIRRAYDREAVVVHPPVATKPAIRKQREDFLLVLGRLVEYKRVDLAILAAERLKIPLCIAGDGPERGRLQRLAGPRTTFLGGVDEATAGDLMERCRAFVFCAEEDFGITPVEANAHGAPVVAYARGGVLETMVPAVTAEFFATQSVDDVVAAIQAAVNRSWDEAAMRQNARRFAPERFRESFRAVLEQALSGPPERAPARA